MYELNSPPVLAAAQEFARWESLNLQALNV
jgi:hypothetical protein